MKFILKAIFETSPEVLFTSWLSSEGHSKMTGAAAEASDSVGASFTAWDGYISGRNLDIEPYRRILQSWRAAEFEDEHEDSELEILFEDLNGKTELTLIHRNLPETLGEQYRQGWEDFYFKPIAKFVSEM
jgi:activator of HSP90 ATPase